MPRRLTHLFRDFADNLNTMITETLGPVAETARGFEIIEFRDRYDVPCSLQQSSLADSDRPGASAVWFGPDDASPKVIWHEAAAAGVKTDATCGWVDFPLPAQVSCNTRAHLSRDQVEALVNHLQAWLKNGTFTHYPATA